MTINLHMLWVRQFIKQLLHSTDRSFFINHGELLFPIAATTPSTPILLPYRVILSGAPDICLPTSFIFSPTTRKWNWTKREKEKLFTNLSKIMASIEIINKIICNPNTNIEFLERIEAWKQCWSLGERVQKKK